MHQKYRLRGGCPQPIGEFSKALRLTSAILAVSAHLDQPVRERNQQPDGKQRTIKNIHEEKTFYPLPLGVWRAPPARKLASLYLVCISPIRWLCVSGKLDRVSTGGRSHPCILFASPRFGGSVLVGNWIGFRREAGRILRRISSAAWIIDRPTALLSHAVENPRPFEPAFTRSAREMVQGRGAGTQSNPNRGGRTW